MNWKLALIVGLGGFIGSIGRYGVDTITKRLITDFPSGTLFVNIVGSFLIGILFAYVEKGILINAGWRVFLITGICGGFTTFSAFSLENHMLYEQGYFNRLLINVMLSVLLGFMATFAGLHLIRKF